MVSKRLIPVVAALLGAGALLFILVRPAMAGGPWAPDGVECQVDTKTITVMGEVNHAGPTVDDIYYNGRLVYSKNVQTDDMGEGRGAYVLKVPYVKLGGEVEVVNRDSGRSVATICHNAVALNAGHGERWAVLYTDQDDAGGPAIKVYCIRDGQGQYGGMFSREEFRAVKKSPDTHLPVKTLTACAVPVAGYVLTTGEWQINIGPDGEGKSAVMVFNKVPPINIHFYDIDPNLPVWY